MLGLWKEGKGWLGVCSSFLDVFFAILVKFLVFLLVAAETSCVSMPGLLQYVYMLVFSASGQVLFSLFLRSDTTQTICVRLPGTIIL